MPDETTPATPTAPSPQPAPVAAETTPTAPAPATETAAPAAAVPVSAPVTDTKAVDGAAVTPTAPTTPAPEAPKAAEAKATEKTPEQPASLLSTAGKETQPAAEAAPAKPEAQAEAAPLPKYDAPTLPDGFTVQPTALGEFDTLLGGFEQSAKADHATVSDLRQKLVDMYVADKKRSYDLQRQEWANTRKNWVDEIKKDRVLGGGRFDTVRSDGALVRDMFATPRFLEMIELTGAGDHPGMWEFVHNVARYLDKRGLLKEGKPVPATKGPAQAMTKKERRYGAVHSGNGAA